MPDVGDAACGRASGNVGLEYGRVALVVDEDGAWPVAFERFADAIRASVPGDAVRIEHVGSTAVPGLVSKPIIDIAIGLADATNVSDVRAKLERLGYEFRGDKGDQGGLLFVLEDAPKHRVAHLHVVRHGDPSWMRYLRFRDRLRSDAADRVAYAEVKLRLARQHPNDRAAYTAGKEAFITDVLSRV
jgi:GrpB-like predicted nucleotidyltransferase (UPF0157 family)